MAGSVAEAKAAIGQANMQAGEAWGALEESKGGLAGAMNAADDARDMAAAALNGAYRDEAASAVAFFNMAAEKIRSALQVVDEAQNDLLAGQNNCVLYMGAF